MGVGGVPRPTHGLASVIEQPAQFHATIQRQFDLPFLPI